MIMKTASNGAWPSIQGSIRSVLYWLPRAQRNCCFTSLRSRERGIRVDEAGVLVHGAVPLPCSVRFVSVRSSRDLEEDAHEPLGHEADP